MPTPPTLVAAYATPPSSTAAAATMTTSSLSLQAGDVVTIVAMGAGGGSGDSFSIPTTTFANGGVTQLALHPSSSDCQGGAWTFTVTSTGSGTVSVTHTGGTNTSQNLFVVAHRGAVAPTAARASISIGSSYFNIYTASQANSAIVWMVGDWSAGAVSTPLDPTPTSHGAAAPGPTALPQSGTQAGQYTEWSQVLDNQTSTGAITYGLLSSSTSGPYTIAVVEVQGGGVFTTPGEGAKYHDDTLKMWELAGIEFSDGSF